MLDRVAGAGLFAVDSDFRITSFSRAAQRLTGYVQEEVLGNRCFEVFCGLASGQGCPMRSSLEKGIEAGAREVYFRTKGLASVPFQITTLPLRDTGARIVGGVEAFEPLGTASFSSVDFTGDLQHFHVAHPQFQKIMRMLPDVARSDAPVLLVGESGTGKHLLAREIHRLSRRSEGPWVKVDCGAYRERVLEVELFGCCRSMLHGIEEDRPGRIQLASGGTVFVQEADCIPNHLQVKLLGFLQDGEVEPLGGKSPVAVDTRLIAASHRNLRALVDEGAFREDLYFRLNVFLMEIPPLRSMRQVIPLIITQLIQRYNRLDRKKIQGICSEALEILMRYPFPGNLRELENIIHHAHVLCKIREITREHLPDQIVSPEGVSPLPLEGENGKRMEEIEREVIQAALARNRWNRKKTAEELGIDRTTLWRKMRKMGWGTKVRPT